MNRSSATLLIALAQLLVTASAHAQNAKHLRLELRPFGREGVDPQRPPVFYRGKQIESLVALRKELRKIAQPGEKPREDGRSHEPVGELDGKKLWPSTHALFVDADGLVEFGWFRFVQYACTMIPDAPRERELRESPLIWDLRNGLIKGPRPEKTPKHVPLPDYVLKPPLRPTARDDDAAPRAVITLTVPKAEWMRPPHERSVEFYVGPDDRHVGRSLNATFDKEGVLLGWMPEPADTLESLERYAKRTLRSSGGAAAMRIGNHVPMMYYWHVCTLLADEGYRDITYPVAFDPLDLPAKQPDSRPSKDGK